MKFCNGCGEKIVKNTNDCVKCGRKVDFGKEKYKRLQIYASLGMAVSLCFGVFLGSRNLEFASQNPTLTVEEITVPEKERSEESFDTSAQEVRFIPEVTVKKSELDEQNLSIQDDFLLEYLEDQVILLDYLGNESEISLPDQVTIIATQAFMKNDVIRKVTLPASLTIIEEDSFAFCLLLEEINWSQQIITLEDGSFRHCESLSRIHLPESLEEIGARSFYGCESLKELHMGDAVKEIGEFAFKNCWNLEEITLSQNLRAIRATVFENCASLIEISIPEFVVNMEEDLFSTCFSLEKVWVMEGSYGESYVNEWMPEVEVEFL